MSQFNRNMLCLARELRAITQTGLAKKSGMSQSKVSKIEGGLLQPDDTDLQKLVEALDVPVAFFFHRGPRPARGSSCVYHRKKQSARVRDLNRLYAQFALLRIQIEELLAGVVVDSRQSIHQIDIDAFDGDAATIAKIVRQTWGLPPGPVDNLTTSIERAGGIVFRTDFDCADVVAMSFWPEGMPTIIFTDAASPGDRLRFSLAHELGHLVMHAIPVGDIETQANRFAAEFLMPEASIRAELSGRTTLQKLAALKPRWKVSMQALARRAFDLDIVTERKYRSLMTQFSKLGWRKSEPVRVAPEIPTVIQSIISHYLGPKRFTEKDLSALTICHEHQFRRDFLDKQSPPGPNLRIAR